MARAGQTDEDLIVPYLYLKSKRPTSQKRMRNFTTPGLNS
jgi:hypothetical protein